MFRADRVPRSKVAKQTNGFFLHCRCIERCSDLRQGGAPLIPAFLPHYVKGDCFQQTGRGQSFWQLVQKIGIVRPGSKSSARMGCARVFRWDNQVKNTQVSTRFFDGGVPNRIRTGVAAVKGRCPGPLDDGDAAASRGSRAASRINQLSCLIDRLRVTRRGALALRRASGSRGRGRPAAAPASGRSGCTR